MSTLIPILLSQHRAVEKRLKAVQQAVDALDGTRIQVELPPLKATLSSHLRLEDGELYPGLLRMAKDLGDSQLSTLAEAYAQSIPQLSHGVLSFLGRYERAFTLEAFLKDWITMNALVTSRIRSEERSLYGMFEAAQARLLARTSPSVEF
jgi:hypothetical protein